MCNAIDFCENLGKFATKFETNLWGSWLALGTSNHEKISRDSPFNMMRIENIEYMYLSNIDHEKELKSHGSLPLKSKLLYCANILQNLKVMT